MSHITIFQCVPAYRAIPTNRIISSLKKLPCRILLDLEDSIQDVFMPGNTVFIKQQARRDLIKLFELNSNFKFDIRINSLPSGEYEKDMALLKEYRHNIQSVFIPKTEQVSDILSVVEEAGDEIPVNPIIETVKGIKNLDKLITPLVKNKVEFFFFGNYDFHLDAGIFPIHEQDTEAYWQIVKPVIKTVENGFHFGNSPYSNISDVKTLHQVFTRLKSLCHKDFAVMALHKIQTLEYLKMRNTLDEDHAYMPPDASENIIGNYISGKLKGRSFAVDKKTKRIITPQEYLLAVHKGGK